MRTLLLRGVVVVAVVAFCIVTAAQTVPPQSRERLINQKALAVNANDKDSVVQLVDAVVLAEPVTRDFIGTTGELHNQLVQAELAYHRGTHKGVPEAAVTHLINRLAAFVDAPAWAFTTDREVRRFRANMLLSHPALIGIQPASRRSAAPRKALPLRMSPAESVLVFTTLFYQKLSNPEWQITPEEEKALWVARHSKGYHPATFNSQRSMELSRKINAASERMSLRDIQQIATNSLAEFGIGGPVK